MTSPKQEHIETNGQGQARLVLNGQWLYDNTAPMTVQIFAINHDYYYEMDKQDGCVEDGQEPELNQNGEMYMVAWHNDKYFSFAGSVGFGGLTLEEAKASAERVVKHIDWAEPITTKYI
jgi:hypothetical protein